MTQDRNIKWVTFRQHLQDLMRDIFENARDTDCIVKVEGKEIYVHRAILCASSDYFHFLIKSAPVFETPTLIIADYDYNLIKDIIVFIYTGEMFVENDRYAEFRDACMNLGLKSFDKKKSHDTSSGSGGVMSKKKIKREKDTLAIPIEEVHVEEIAMVGYEINEEMEEESVEEQKPIKKKRSYEKGYDELDLECAIKESEAGVPVAEVAKKYNVPRNTLYGKIKTPEFKKEKLELVERAIREILETGISIRQAAQKHVISKTNLWFHFKQYKEKHPNLESTNLRENKKPNRSRQKLKKNLQAQPATTLEQLRDKANEFKIRLQNAISDCKNGDLLADVSAKHEIPEETIYRNVKNMNLPHIELNNYSATNEEHLEQPEDTTDQWWKPV